MLRPVDHLSGRGKNLEAAKVFMEYADDVDNAVDVLTRGAEFAEAYRLVGHRGLRDEGWVANGLGI